MSRIGAGVRILRSCLVRPQQGFISSRPHHICIHHDWRARAGVHRALSQQPRAARSGCATPQVLRAAPRPGQRITFPTEELTVSVPSDRARVRDCALVSGDDRSRTIYARTVGRRAFWGFPLPATVTPQTSCSAVTIVGMLLCDATSHI